MVKQFSINSLYPCEGRPFSGRTAGIQKERDRSTASAFGGKECTDIKDLWKLQISGRFYAGGGDESVSVRVLSGYEKMYMYACTDPYVFKQNQPSVP